MADDVERQQRAENGRDHVAVGQLLLDGTSSAHEPAAKCSDLANQEPKQDDHGDQFKGDDPEHGRECTTNPGTAKPARRTVSGTDNPFYMIEQALAVGPPVSHAKELYGLAAIFATQIGLAIVAHVKGRTRPVDSAKRMDLALNNALTPIGIKLDSLGNDVQDLKAHVVGPDGQNGLRGDHRDLRRRVDGLEDRERART